MYPVVYWQNWRRSCRMLRGTEKRWKRRWTALPQNMTPNLANWRGRCVQRWLDGQQPHRFLTWCWCWGAMKPLPDWQTPRP